MVWLFYNTFFKQSDSVGHVRLLYICFGLAVIGNCMSFVDQYSSDWSPTVGGGIIHIKVAQDTTKLAFHVFTTFVYLCFECASFSQQ